MARRKKRTGRSGSCSGPVDGMIDLIGAVAMGVFAKHKIKRDYTLSEGVWRR